MALLEWLFLYFQKKKCHQCGKKLESAPAICKFCGYWFCDKHISPKNHNCKGKTSKYNRIMGLLWNVNVSFRYYLGIILMFLGLLWFLGNMKRGGSDFLIGLLVDLLVIVVGFILFITSYNYKKKKNIPGRENLIMNWKQFLKPGKWNSIVFTVIVFSYFILIEFSVKSESIYSVFQIVFIFFLTLPLLPIGFILLMKEMSGVNEEIINLLLKILMVIYWYFLSCLIVWFYDKRRKEKK